MRARACAHRMCVCMRDCITNVHVRLYMYLTIRDVVEQVATEIMRAKRENVALVGLVMVLCVFVDEFVCVHVRVDSCLCMYSKFCSYADKLLLPKITYVPDHQPSTSNIQGPYPARTSPEAFQVPWRACWCQVGPRQKWKSQCFRCQHETPRHNQHTRTHKQRNLRLEHCSSVATFAEQIRTTL